MHNTAWWNMIAIMARSKFIFSLKALPPSVIDLHPQSPDIDFIAAKTRCAVASGNRTGTGVDQIVAADPGAVALRQPP